MSGRDGPDVNGKFPALLNHQSSNSPRWRRPRGSEPGHRRADGTWQLPAAATFVTGRDKTIAAGEVTAGPPGG